MIAGCTSTPIGGGPLDPHGHLEFLPNATIAVHTDFYNDGDSPLVFPAYENGEVETAYLSPDVFPTDGAALVRGIVIDGPTGEGRAHARYFNGSDVIPPRSWWNTTIHVRYDSSPDSSWLYGYSASIMYREQNGTRVWEWNYYYPCYNMDHTVNTTAPRCDRIDVLR
jgi:hypothetical protein